VVLIGWSFVWGLVQFVPLLDGSAAAGVVGGAQALSETIELAANLTLGEVGVVAGACCEAAVFVVERRFSPFLDQGSRRWWVRLFEVC